MQFASNGPPEAVLMTVKEVAKRLNISPSMVYSLVERGLLASFRLGRSVRLSLEQVEEFLAKNERVERQGISARKQFRHLDF